MKTIVWLLIIIFSVLFIPKIKADVQKTGDLVIIKILEPSTSTYAYVANDASILQYKGITKLNDSKRIGGNSYLLFIFKVKKVNSSTKVIISLMNSQDNSVKEVKIIEIKT